MLADSSRINCGLPQLPEGAPPELFQQFYALYSAIHKLEKLVAQFSGADQYPNDWWPQLTLDDSIYAGGDNRLYVRQGDALTFGECVNLYSNAGVLTVRKANATTNVKFACGFVTSNDHVSAIGEFCEVMVGNAMLTGVGGLAVGTRYFLSTVDGLVTNAAPVAAGNIEQVIGIALAPTRLYMNLNFGWIQH